MTVISVETAKTYLLERVGELKAQVSHGNPFVFLGAFSVLNAVGRPFNSSIYSLLQRFGDFTEDEASVAQQGARLMFEGFTLTEPKLESQAVGDNRVFSCQDYQIYLSVGDTGPTLKKLNLSHKDRLHKKRSGEKFTLSAGAFLEDIELVINKAFDSVKDDEVASAQLFVNINSQPLIGYGD